jgi:superfamily II helicase
MKKFGARKFRGEMFCQRCAEKHLSKLKTKLTDKKLAEILADEKLKIAEKALRKAQQAVQAPKEHKNKTQIDAKKAENDLLEFSKAMEMTPFSGRIRNEYFLN